MFEKFLEELKQTLISTLHDIIAQEVELQVNDRWFNKQQLADCWGVSVSWIDKNLNSIPHYVSGPVRFQRSKVDAWFNGEYIEKKEPTKVSVKNYNSKNFRVGR